MKKNSFKILVVIVVALMLFSAVPSADMAAVALSPADVANEEHALFELSIGGSDEAGLENNRAMPATARTGFPMPPKENGPRFLSRGPSIF